METTQGHCDDATGGGGGGGLFTPATLLPPLHRVDGFADSPTQAQHVVRPQTELPDVANPRAGRRVEVELEEPPAAPPPNFWAHHPTDDPDVTRFYFLTGRGANVEEVAVHTYCVGAAVRYDERSGRHFAGYAAERVDAIHRLVGPVEDSLPSTLDTAELVALVAVVRQALYRDEAYLNDLIDRAEEGRRQRTLEEQSRGVADALARSDVAAAAGAAASMNGAAAASPQRPPGIKQETDASAHPAPAVSPRPRLLDELSWTSQGHRPSPPSVPPPATLVVRTTNAWVMHGARRGIVLWLRQGFSGGGGGGGDDGCPVEHRELWLDYWTMRKRREEIRRRYLEDFASLPWLNSLRADARDLFCHSALQILAVHSHGALQCARSAECVAATGALTAVQLAATKTGQSAGDSA